MLRRDNTAEGGTAGVTIDATNTGGLSGDLFSHVQDAGTTIRFATAAVVHGALGYEFIGAASASCFLQWTGDVEPSYAIRGYLRASALPPVAASASLAFAQVRTASGTAGSASMTGDGRFRILDTAGGTAANGTAVVSGIALGVGHRFEFRVTPGTTTTNGTAQLQVFVGDAALNTTPLETLTATGNFKVDAPTHVRFGRVTAGTTVWNFWLDDLALQTGGTGFIGPAGGAPNAAPIPNAGQDQAVEVTQATVTLTGTDTDSDGTVVTRTWTQTSGTPVTLTGTGATRTFTRPLPLDGESLTFAYTVTDDRGQQAADPVTVYLLPVTERAVIGGVEVPMQMESVKAATTDLPAAPVLLTLTEPQPRATRLTRNALEAGTVWDVYEAGSTNAVATGITDTFRQSGQVLTYGATYTYWAKARRLSDGAVSAESNHLTITLAAAPVQATATTTLAADSPYRVNVAWPADADDPTNQPWQVERSNAWPVRVLGTKYKSPHLRPGAHTFRYRKELTPADTTTGAVATYGPWADAPAATIKAWPSVTAKTSGGVRMARWGLPLDWGQRADFPGIRTINITSTYDITAAGDYLLRLPTTGPLNVGRLDINIRSTVTGPVRFAMIGGELHTDPTAAIALKLNSDVSKVPIFGFLQGIRFSGGNNGDAIQVNWATTTDSTLIVQDIVVDPPIVGEQTGQHSDIIQCYGGPGALLIDGLEGHSTYQVLMLNPAQFGLGFRTAAEGPGWYGDYGFSRINAVGEPRVSDGKASTAYYLIPTGQSAKPDILYPSTGEAGLFQNWTTATAPGPNLSHDVTLDANGAQVYLAGDQKPGIWVNVQRGVTPAAGTIVDTTGPHRPGVGYVQRPAAPIPA